jgi:hypothetical protein
MQTIALSLTHTLSWSRQPTMLAAMLLLTTHTAARTTTPILPNILHILLDDFGWADAGMFTLHPPFPTPLARCALVW